jgi:fructose/tagatose bisphosphate aldolase
MTDAERSSYAVGYFESWNLESLLGVADAAEAQRSPVILGVSGIYLPHPERRAPEALSVHYALSADVGRQLSVPCCLLFNESPHLDWVMSAIDLGFHLVMYTRDDLTPEELQTQVRAVADRAHARSVAVEGELTPLAGAELALDPDKRRLTDPEAARDFVDATQIDALAVNIGQEHLHGRRTVALDLDRLRRIRHAVGVPLVLHGATSVARDSLRQAVALGVRKINVGSALKQAFFEAVRAACEAQGANPNPYAVVGSGLPADVLLAGRLAVRTVVEEFLPCFGSAGRVGRALP